MNKLILTKPLEKKKIVRSNNNKGIYYDKVIVPFNFNDPLYKILFFLRNNNVKNIYNVFQPSYGDEKTTGFGDFIRGCYFLMQFCEEKNFHYGFRISNHPLKHLLKNFAFSSDLPNTISSSIKKHMNTNFKENKKEQNENEKNVLDINSDFLYFLKDLEIHNFSLYIHTTAFPDKPIPQKHKDIMKLMLSPTLYLEQKILSTFNELKLQKDGFITIHIRFGDKYLTGEKLVNDENNRMNDFIKIDESIMANCKLDDANDNEEDSYFKMYNDYFDDDDKHKIEFIINFIQKYKENNENKNILLLADNENIKKLLLDVFPFIKTTSNKIVHTRENNDDENVLMNTMVDFYLMSYSKSINAFSVYEHGSGFSKWSAETYNIPYTSIFLSDI